MWRKMMFGIWRDACPLAKLIRAHGESLAMHVAENSVWNLSAKCFPIAMHGVALQTEPLEPTTLENCRAN